MKAQLFVLCTLIAVSQSNIFKFSCMHHYDHKSGYLLLDSEPNEKVVVIVCKTDCSDCEPNSDVKSLSAVQKDFYGPLHAVIVGNCTINSSKLCKNYFANEISKEIENQTSFFKLKEIQNHGVTSGTQNSEFDKLIERIKAPLKVYEASILNKKRLII